MFEDMQSLKAYLFAGDATITLRSRRTGKRYTYRLRRSKDRRVVFLSVLTGPDNDRDYGYVGYYRGGDTRFRRTAKSRLSENAPAVSAWRWFERLMEGDRLSPDLEVFHDGRCGRCRRKLTVPESVQRGLGPHCAAA